MGAGIGALSYRLAEGRRYEGYEPDATSFEIARQHLSAFAGAVVHNAPLPEEPTGLFDALVALEVLEHLDDDKAALFQWTRWVSAGGSVILSVPAKEDRFGPMDRAVGHVRRYDRDRLEELMEAAGLQEIRLLAYGMPLGYLLEYVRNRLLARRLPDAGDANARTSASGRSFQPSSNPALIATMLWPFRMMQRPFSRTEFGIGWVATGRVPR